MLGRQFNVIVTDDDLRLVEDTLTRRGDVRYLSSSTNEARTALLPIRSLRIEDSPPGPWRHLCYLAPLGRPPRIDIEPVSDVKVHIEVSTSELIEFNRSYCERGEIQGNRVFYTPRFFDDEGFHDKDPEFVKWAEQVVAAVKRVLTYDKLLMAQVGPDAAQKIASGELRVIS